MHVHEAIQSRRSIFQFKPGPVPDELLEKILSFGVWAPNHLLTEPWRFTALGEAARQTLAQRYGEVQVKKAPADADNKLRELMRAGGVKKFLSKPTIVVVSCLQEGDEQQRREPVRIGDALLQPPVDRVQQVGAAGGAVRDQLARDVRAIGESRGNRVDRVPPPVRREVGAWYLEDARVMRTGVDGGDGFGRDPDPGSRSSDLQIDTVR